MSVAIRKLRKEDVHVVHGLLMRVLTGMKDKYYPADFIADQKHTYTQEVLARKIAKPDGTMLGAFEEGACMGFILSFPISAGLWYIEWMVVAPSVRRKGIAGRLLRQSENAAKRAKCHKIYLYTSLKNIPAAQAYLKYGYSIEGVLRNHFLGNDFLFFAKMLSRKGFSKKYNARPDFLVRES